MRLKIKVKPNQPETKILKEGEELVIAVAAPADKSKANIELLKFLRRKYKKEVKLISGTTSRKKIVQLS